MPARERSENLHVGGQAVIEGVMMRSPRGLATAVRVPDGRIVIKAENFISLTKRNRILALPVIRGAVMMIETLSVAIKALSFSADQAVAEDEKKKEGGKSLSTFQMVMVVAGAFALGFLVFFYIPLLITEAFGFKSGFFFNLVDGILRLLFVFLYIVLISRWKDMRRVFEYHGAEHKTIFAFEDDPDVTCEKAAARSRLHPRCSTSFLLIIVIVSVLVFVFLGRPENIADRLVRFSLIPVIAGISYELLKLSARPGIDRKIGFLFWPGLFLQRFTTKEPSADQIEVAIAALNACLDDKLLERNGIIN
ncbi:MAG: DUF1385 domain-containing protein [Candidatus Krumholzibacteriota bacterium]|nr:DUF1385 domain-containing protein [Candidatus Krumholzibacteriota bacterium]